MFYHFLWNGKGDKIKSKVMINDSRYSGLKMIDLYSFNKCLKTTWVKVLGHDQERKMETPLEYGTQELWL